MQIMDQFSMPIEILLLLDSSIGDFSDESSVFFCLLSFSIEYMQIFFSVGLYFVAFFAYFSDGVEFMKLVFFSS